MRKLKGKMFHFLVGVEQEFCTKTGADGHGTWPSGRYCILRSGKCPKGLVEG